MRKRFTLFCMVLGFTLHAQKRNYIYFVSFKDKNNSSFSVKKPQEFLSEKALLRRAKYNVRIDETDLPVTELYIKKVCNKKVKFKNSSKWLNGILVEISDTEVVADIFRNEFVVSVQKVAEYNRKQLTKEEENNVATEEITIDSEQHPYTDVREVYGKSFDQIKMLQGIALHQLKYTGEGVTIAVLDAGFFNANKLAWFNKLQRSHQIVLWKDFVDNDFNVFDGNAHGLEVLSCMATGDTGTYIGTAPKARYLLLRSEDAETEQPVEEINWSVAAEFADSCGVDLITTSLGYNLFDDISSSHTHEQLDGRIANISKAAEIAFSKGIVVVCSAGNDGGNPWRHIGFPADAPHALSIGAVDMDRVIAYFSSQGPTADGRVKPDVSAPGVSAAVESPDGTVAFSNGTSFSAPITAGLVACLMQAHPSRSPQQINDAVRQSADRADIQDTIYGFGIPDFNLANLILGDSSLDSNKDQLVNVSYNAEDKMFAFTIYSASPQIMGFKLVDENGTIIKTGTQQCMNKKFQHFYIDELALPYSKKGYGFIIENDQHQTFVKLF